MSTARASAALSDANGSGGSSSAIPNARHVCRASVGVITCVGLSANAWRREKSAYEDDEIGGVIEWCCHERTSRQQVRAAELLMHDQIGIS